MKFKKKIMLVMLLFFVFVLHIKVNALNLANVKSSSSSMAKSNGYYYYFFTLKSGKKEFKNVKNNYNKYVDYDLGDNYTLRLTLMHANVYSKVYTSTSKVWNSELKEYRSDLNGCTDAIPRSICNNIANNDYGRLVAIKTDGISIDIYGIRELRVQYTLFYKGAKMESSDIEEHFGEVNIKLIDIDHQQAIKIASDYTFVEKDDNILRDQKYNISATPKFSTLVTETDFFQSDMKSCPKDGCTGYIKFKTQKNNIKLSFFSGQEKWRTSSSGYKYGHAYFKFVTGDIETTPDKTLTIEKKAYKSDGTQYSSGSIPKFSFKVQKLNNSGGVLKEKNIETNNRGIAKLNLSGDWKCAKNKCKYRVLEDRRTIKDTWSYWHYPSGKWSDEAGVDGTDWPEITYKYAGEDLTFTFKNKEKSEEGCDADLKNLVNGKGTFNSSTKEATFTTINPKVLYDLVELYEKWKNSPDYPNPNKLLYFNGKDGKMTVSCKTQKVTTYGGANCNSGLGFSFAKRYARSDYEWYDIQTAGFGKNSLFNEGIHLENGGRKVHTYCFIYDFSFKSDTIKKIENEDKPGTMIWIPSASSPDIGSGSLKIQCNMYLPETGYNNETGFNDNYSETWKVVKNGLNAIAEEIENIEIESTEDQNKNIVFDFDVEGENYFKVQKEWSSGGAQVIYQQFEMGFKVKYSQTIKFKKNTGTITESDSNVVDGGYGYPIPMGLQPFKTYYPNFELKFSNEEDKTYLKDYFSIDSNYPTTCSYDTGEGLTGCKLGDPECSKQLNLEFRIIDTENPFPGINGTGRTTGSNWSGKESEITDTTKNNNSYNKSKKDPLISIRLTPTNIEAISSKYNGYNKDHSYDDFELDCTEGKECTSSFVTRLLNGEFGAVEGSCEKVSNRKYCVGES